MSLYLFPADAIRYVSPHIANDPTRPQLSSILCDAAGIFVATSGHTLGAYRTGGTIDAAWADENITPETEHEHDDVVTLPPYAFCLQFDKVAHAVAAKVHACLVALPDVAGSSDIRRPVSLRDRVGREIGVTLATISPASYFPNWRAVVEGAARDMETVPVPMPFVGYRRATLAPFLAPLPNVKGTQYGDAPDGLLFNFSGAPAHERVAVVRYPSAPNFVGLIMPYRTDAARDRMHDTGGIVPAWARYPEGK
jgi:hypothetical protein